MTEGSRLLRVLGIDPGTLHMGLGLVESRDGALSLLKAYVLSPARGRPLAERLGHLHEGLVEAMDTWRPDSVAIEEPFVARNVRSAMAVGQAQAVAMVAASGRGLTVSSYSPSEVKQAVTDHGGSSKAQVQAMVRVILGVDGADIAPDAADALAVAICHVNAGQAAELIS